MRSDDLLKKLRQAGTKGLRSEQIANIFDFKKPGSSNKIINTLRKQGFIIKQAEKKSPYVLFEEKETKLEEMNENDLDSLAEEIIDDTEDEEDKEDKLLPKKDRIYKLLAKNIKYGIPKEKIASMIDIHPKTVTYHMHSLRSQDGHNIKCIKGRYFLTNKRQYNKKIQNNVIEKDQEDIEKDHEDEELILEKALNDKELFQGIQIMPKDVLQQYIDLLYKIIYYRKCAKAMIDTNKILRRTGEIF